MPSGHTGEISYDKFIDMVDKDQVKEVTIQSNTLTIVPKKQNSKYEDMSYYTTKTEDSTALTKRLEGKGIKFETDPPDAFGEPLFYAIQRRRLVWRLTGVSKRGFKRNQRGRKEQKRNDSGSGIAFSACRSDYRPEQGRKEPPEDFPASEGNICCDAPAWEYNAVNQH